MGQFFGIEDIKAISKSSQTLVAWEAGSTLRIGGQGYTIDSALIMDIGLDIDTGAVAADTKYYIYAVVVAGVVSLKYSLSDTAPTGYNAYKKLGDLLTDATPEIDKVNDDSKITRIKDIVYLEVDFFDASSDYDDKYSLIHTFTDDYDECYVDLQMDTDYTTNGSNTQRVYIGGLGYTAGPYYAYGGSSSSGHMTTNAKQTIGPISKGEKIEGYWTTWTDNSYNRRVKGILTLIKYT